MLCTAPLYMLWFDEHHRMWRCFALRGPVEATDFIDSSICINMMYNVMCLCVCVSGHADMENMYRCVWWDVWWSDAQIVKTQLKLVASSTEDTRINIPYATRNPHHPHSRIYRTKTSADKHGGQGNVCSTVCFVISYTHTSYANIMGWWWAPQCFGANRGKNSTTKPAIINQIAPGVGERGGIHRGGIISKSPGWESRNHTHTLTHTLTHKRHTLHMWSVWAPVFILSSGVFNGLCHYTNSSRILRLAFDNVLFFVYAKSL